MLVLQTCNFNNRDWYFQPDTGPVLFPANLEAPLEDIIDDVQLAFIAWNAYDGSAVHPGGQQPGWAEFLVRQPSPVATDQQGQTVEVAAICFVAVVRRTDCVLSLQQVQHYGKAVRVECLNSVYRV